MLLVTTPRFEPRSTGVRAIVAGLQVRAAVMLVGSQVSPLRSVGSIRSYKYNLCLQPVPMTILSKFWEL